MTLLDSALEYRARGWSVIPILPRSKKPLLRSWEPYQRRLATEDEIRDWWGKNPDANIGIITGSISGIIAVDVDTKRGGKARDIHAESDTGTIAQTGSGGFHLIYDYPSGVARVPNQTDARPGVDIRGDGGYIVVAPSVHENGREYHWVSNEQRGQPPLWAVRREGATEPRTSAPGEKWLADILGGVKKGNRNDAMTRLVGYLAGKEIPLDVSKGILIAWNARNEDPGSLTEQEMDATLKSVYPRVRAKSKPIELTQPTQGEFEVTRLAQYANQFGGTSMQWMVQDWLPRSTIGFLVSPPETYKTWITMDLAVSIASGHPFLGHYPVLDTGPVMLIQQEDHHGQTVERLGVILMSRFGITLDGAMGNGEFLMPGIPDIPVYVHPSRRLRFDDPAVMAQFVTKIRQIQPKLVIIDPLYSATSFDDYMSRTAEYMMPLKSLRDAIGTSFLIAHHTTKSQRNDQRMEIWGSQFLNAFLETGWQLRPGEGHGVVNVSRHYKATSRPESMVLQFNINTVGHGSYSVDINPAGVNGASEKTEDEVLAVLVDKGPLVVTAIAKVMGQHHEKVRRRLKKLEKDGFVKRSDSGKYSAVGPQLTMGE